MVNALLNFRIFHNQNVIDLVLENEQRELNGMYLSISVKGSAMEWRT